MLGLSKFLHRLASPEIVDRQRHFADSAPARRQDEYITIQDKYESVSAAADY
jgi:hypothetical protein